MASFGGNVKAVCEWIGNSPEVAMKHYAQTTEADMKEAAKMSVLNDAENTVQKRVQNRVQPMTETSGNVQQEEIQEDDVSPFDGRNLPTFSEPCRNTDKSSSVFGTIEDGHKGLLGNVDHTDGLHAFFALFLLFQQFHFSCYIPTV